MSHVIDYSFARPNPAAIKRAGYTGVLRYVCPINEKTRDKVINRAECDALRAAGLDVTLNFEWFETRPTAGAAAGHEDAKTANDQADAIGYPADCAIYYSVDSAQPWNAVSAYFQAIAESPRRPVGIYGGWQLIRSATDAGHARFGWVANAASWSNCHSWSELHAAVVANPAGVNLLQHLHDNTPFSIDGTDNTAFDPNTVLSPDYGQWAIQPNGGFLMALSDREQHDLLEAATSLHHNLLQGIGHSLVNDALGVLTQIKARVDKVPTAADIAKAVVDALPPGQAVDVDRLAAAIVKASGAQLIA